MNDEQLKEKAIAFVSVFYALPHNAILESYQDEVEAAMRLIEKGVLDESMVSLSNSTNCLPTSGVL